MVVICDNGNAINISDVELPLPPSITATKAMNAIAGCGVSRPDPGDRKWTHGDPENPGKLPRRV